MRTNLAEFLRHPEVGARMRSGQSDGLLPEPVLALSGVEQERSHHPEGDAFVHTAYVVQAARDICLARGLDGERFDVLMISALFHDVGKAKTTRWNEEKGKITSYGHDSVGANMAAQWLVDNGYDEGFADVVWSLVCHHMAHCRPGFTEKAVRKLLLHLAPASLDDLLLLMEADCAGRPPLPPGLPRAVTEELIPIARKVSGEPERCSTL